MLTRKVQALAAPMRCFGQLARHPGADMVVDAARVLVPLPAEEPSHV